MVEQVAELEASTVPPEPVPVEKQLVAPEDSSSWRVPEAKVLVGLTIVAEKPPRVAAATPDRATTETRAATIGLCRRSTPVLFIVIFTLSTQQCEVGRIAYL
jgi:hypothetical protein